MKKRKKLVIILVIIALVALLGAKSLFSSKTILKW